MSCALDRGDGGVKSSSSSGPVQQQTTGLGRGAKTSERLSKIHIGGTPRPCRPDITMLNRPCRQCGAVGWVRRLIESLAMGASYGLRTPPCRRLILRFVFFSSTASSSPQMAAAPIGRGAQDIGATLQNPYGGTPRPCRPDITMLNRPCHQRGAVGWVRCLIESTRNGGLSRGWKTPPPPPQR